MFHSRASNIKINLLQERALRMIYNDQTSLLKRLFEKDNSFTVHHFNIQSLAIKKVRVSICNHDVFTKSYNRYILRSKSNFVLLGVRTV